MNILLVGGAVRNLLLGRPVMDKDFLVTGITREDFASRFPSAKEVGEHFPVFILNGDEYSFLRADTLENDFLARDFTINCMALDENGHLFAHPKALEDLHARKLAPASDTSFAIDPLRIFRAARFLSELDDFTASETLLEKMHDASRDGAVKSLSAERVGKELRRALASDSPANFLYLLNKTKNLKPWFNELARADELPAGPAKYHDSSVLGHTMAVMNRLAGQGPLRVWMGMVHDLGKCTTPKNMLPRHLNHDKRGEKLAQKLGTRLRLPNRFIRAGAVAARWHMIAAQYPILRAGTKVNLLTRLGSKEAIADLFAVSRADRKDAPDHGPTALADYQHITNVHLPKEHRNQRQKSGEMLHQLRTQALLAKNFTRSG